MPKRMMYVSYVDTSGNVTTIGVKATTVTQAKKLAREKLATMGITVASKDLVVGEQSKKDK